MLITIQTIRFSSPTSYEITTPGAIYTAKNHIFGDTVTLCAPGGRDLATIKRQFSLLHTRYEIDLHQGNVHLFRSNDAYKNAYICEFESDSYTVFVHKKLKYSIFLNGKQIASLTREALSVAGAVTSDLLMNDEADFNVVVCLALTICDMDPPDPAGVTYDLGSMLAEDMPFDERWQPS
jgi:uncharacterized protein YxjI